MSKVIKLQDETIRELEKLREHKRETWDDIVWRIVKLYKCKSKKQSNSK